MPGSIKLSIDSDLDLVALATRAIRSLCEDRLDNEALYEIEIAIAEAINNVIKHGYHGEHGNEVDVRIAIHAERVEIDVIDHALPIPPEILAGLDSDPFSFDPDDLDALPESGMGFALIRAIMDEVDYRSGDGGNQLHMVKRIPEAAAADRTA